MTVDPGRPDAATTTCTMAIDALFNHPNVGPVPGAGAHPQPRHVEPEPAYVERVAGFFNDNGSGVRGSLWAMVKAVLLDPEARTPRPTSTYGKLKEPARLSSSASCAPSTRMSANRSLPSDGAISRRAATARATRARRSSSRPPSSATSRRTTTRRRPRPACFGPEFGIMDASTSLKRANFINTIVFSSIAINCSATPVLHAQRDVDRPDRAPAARADARQPRRPAQPPDAARHDVRRDADLDRSARSTRSRRRPTR